MSESAHAVPIPSTATRTPYHGGNGGEVKISLSRIAVAVGVLAGLAGLVGAWFILPYRVDQAEKKLSAVEVQMNAQRDVLIRIDENVKELRRQQRAGIARSNAMDGN